MIKYIDMRYDANAHIEDCQHWLLMMLIPLSISTVYDLRQFWMDPKGYVTSSSNNADLLFIILSYVNILK